MDSHTKKTQENNTQNVTHAVSQKQNSDVSTFQFADNRSETVIQRKLQKMASTGVLVQQAIQRMVIQRHQLDNDVLEMESLEAVVKRIEMIAESEDTSDPIQERVTDLWLKQNTLLNNLRAELELESSKDDKSDEAIKLSNEVSGFTTRLSAASLSLFLMKSLKKPNVEPYKSKIGQHLPGGGGN